MNRRPLLVLPAPAVPTVQAPYIELPCEGPGYYALLRVFIARTTGVAAANYTPAVYEVNQGTGPILSARRVWSGPQTAAATALYWPADPTAVEPAPARYAFAPSGSLFLAVTPDVLGDTWQVSAMVEKLR